MKNFCFILTAVFFVAISAHATDSESWVLDTAHPNVQDIAKWREDLLGKYESVNYFDDHGHAISEAIFNQLAFGENRRAFIMHVDSTTPNLLFIKLMSDAEEKTARAEKT